MEGIYVFLLRWDIPILFIATISLIVGLVKLLQARSLMRRAMFSLERDYGRETRQNGSALVIFAVCTIGLLWYINQIVAPTLPDDLLFQPTPTLDPLKTPFASPSPEAPPTEVIERINRGSAELVATATLNPTVSGIEPEELFEEPPRPPTREPVDVFIPDGGGCTPAVNISSPRPESVQTGTTNFIGTATDPRFAFYGLELNGPGTGNSWVNMLDSGNFNTVENDILGSADLSQLEQGNYNVRLSIFDTDVEVIGRCQISIVIGIAEPTLESESETDS